MKKAFLVLALLAVTTSMVWADDSTTTSSSNGKFIWGAGVGFAPEGNGFTAGFNDGLGGELKAGVTLDKNWAIVATADTYFFNATGAGTTGYYTEVINVIPALRYTWDAPGFKPYIFSGVGADDYIVNVPAVGSTAATSTSNIDIAIAEGVGVAFTVSSGLDIYVEGKYEQVFTNDNGGGNFSYFPVTAGVLFN